MITSLYLIIFTVVVLIVGFLVITAIHDTDYDIEE